MSRPGVGGVETRCDLKSEKSVGDVESKDRNRVEQANSSGAGPVRVKRGMEIGCAGHEYRTVHSA